MEKFLRNKLKGGAFVNVTPIRSKTMSAIRGRGNKTTEVRLRMCLVGMGLSGWSLHAKCIPGSPDFVFEHARVAVFIDGCFWHGCPKCGHIPKTNRTFWAAKIARNRERDKMTSARLRRRGYAVLRYWEHEIQQDIAEIKRSLLAKLNRRAINILDERT